MGLSTKLRSIREGELSPDRVLVLSGRSGSGKSKFAKQLVAMHGDWALASCGDFVKAQALASRIDGDQRATDRLGQTLVEQLGVKRFLEAVLEHAEVPANTKTLVIEDVYHVTVFDEIKQRWDHLRFVAAELPPGTRADILRDRGLDPEAIAEVERGHLDHAVEELERVHIPERSIEVPRDEGRLAEVSQELDNLLAQPA